MVCGQGVSGWISSCSSACVEREPSAAASASSTTIDRTARRRTRVIAQAEQGGEFMMLCCGMSSQTEGCIEIASAHFAAAFVARAASMARPATEAVVIARFSLSGASGRP